MELSINDRISEVFMLSGCRSVSAWAKKIGVAQTSLNDLLKRQTEPKYSTLHSILMAEPLVSAEWLMRGAGSMHLQSEQGNSEINEVRQGNNAINVRGAAVVTASENTEIMKRLMDQIDGLQAELSALRKQNEMLTNKLLNV